MRRISHTLDMGGAHAVTIGEIPTPGAVPGLSKWEIPVEAASRELCRLGVLSVLLQEIVMPTSNQRTETSSPTRRQFLKSTSVAVAAGSLASQLDVARAAYAGGSDEIRVALVGCGGRGTQAAMQALSTEGPVKLVAMADAFENRLFGSLQTITEKHAEQVEVPQERQFVGFDAYQQAIDAGADMVILATPPGFRPLHFEAAIKAGKHVFIEKPVAVDAPGVRTVLATAVEAKKQSLCVGVGLQRHHHPLYRETMQRLQDGAIGDILSIRAY